MAKITNIDDLYLTNPTQKDLYRRYDFIHKTLLKSLPQEKEMHQGIENIKNKIKLYGGDFC